MTWLVDTDVISELRKGQRCNRAVATWWSDVSDDEIFLSALTIGEIRQGVERVRRKDAGAALALERWLERIEDGHADRILPVDVKVAARWGQLNVPDPLPLIDGLLAATAIEHGLTLVTRNAKGVERTGVDVLNPWLA